MEIGGVFAPEGGVEGVVVSEMGPFAEHVLDVIVFVSERLCFFDVGMLIWSKWGYNFSKREEKGE